jgi:hypothetical protein
VSAEIARKVELAALMYQWPLSDGIQLFADSQRSAAMTGDGHSPAVGPRSPLPAKTISFRDIFCGNFWITTSGNFSNPALMCSVRIGESRRSLPERCRIPRVHLRLPCKTRGFLRLLCVQRFLILRGVLFTFLGRLAGLPRIRTPG